MASLQPIGASSLDKISKTSETAASPDWTPDCRFTANLKSKGARHVLDVFGPGKDTKYSYAHM